MQDSTGSVGVAIPPAGCIACALPGRAPAGRSGAATVHEEHEQPAREREVAAAERTRVAATRLLVGRREIRRHAVLAHGGLRDLAREWLVRDALEGDAVDVPARRAVGLIRAEAEPELHGLACEHH